MTGISFAQPDVTLVLDMDGIIREATLSRDFPGESVDGWLGQRWEETVDVGGDKIRRMVADARESGLSAFRQVTQRFPSGRELPMEYTTLLLGGRSGLLAIGKNLQAVAELQARLISAQQTMERDYWKLREVETRYRLLFETADEAVVLLRAANLRMIEANPAAISALGLSQRGSDGVAGRELLPIIVADEREAVQAMLLRAREHGKAPAIRVHLGHERKTWMLRASLMTSEPGPIFLLQLSVVGLAALSSGRNDAASVDALIERAPDGFIILDRDGIIRTANQSFADLVEIGSKSSVIGERMARWLTRPGADVAALIANIRRHRIVRLFSTTLQGELGSQTEVEISATGNNENDPEYFGVLVRDVGRRLEAPRSDSRLLAALGAIIHQIGKTSLRKLVGETAGVVERYHIKAALELAEGNRTAAAEILGLSRQSLYAKLNRYGLDGNSTNPSGEE
jgi:transcriptional regulator PpsR